MKRQSHNAKLYTQFDPNYVKAYTKGKKNSMPNNFSTFSISSFNFYIFSKFSTIF